MCVCVCVCVFQTMTSASEIHFPLNFKRHRLGDEHNMSRRGRVGDLNSVRVREGPEGMTAGGGACSDGPSLACLRVEARLFFVIFFLLILRSSLLLRFSLSG